jgi:hypothetical protein
VSIDTLTNPKYPTANGQPLDISIYHPGTSIDSSLPTIFFANGFTSPVGDPADYDTLLTNLASQGYNVVFSPYEGGSSLNIPKRFDELTTGFDAAVSTYALNTAQVGFVGHSYGAGFLPAVVQHEMLGITDQSGTAGHTWGGTSAFMYSMSPGYAYGGIPNTQTITMPANLNVVEQVYNDDTTIADPRLAIDIFNNITTPASQKEFFTVYGDSFGSPAQVANHFLPTTATTSTSLQAWGIFRHLDALAAYTFTGNSTAQAIALGNGAAATYMGVWDTGTSTMPVTPLGATDSPLPSLYSAGPYLVQYTDAANPRKNFALPEPSAFALAAAASALASTRLLWRRKVSATIT